MIYSHEVETMCPVAQGVAHGAAPIPEEAKWVKAKEIKDISGFTHGVGWCAPQQGCCKLSLNVKGGVIQEALVETIGCSGMTHSAAMASEILRMIIDTDISYLHNHSVSIDKSIKRYGKTAQLFKSRYYFYANYEQINFWQRVLMKAFICYGLAARKVLYNFFS